MKILLNGYFHENLGDDLFFRMITQRYPQHQFYMPVHADHADAYRGNANVKVLPLNKLVRGANKLLTAISPKWDIATLAGKLTDLSVLIGGSLFQELDTDGRSLKRLKNMPRHNKGMYILGINFGPHKTQGYLDTCREYLSGAADVCFRDATSYEYFSQLSNTRLGSDIIFGIEDICPAVAEKTNTCVISLMDFEAKPYLAPYARDYYRFLVEMAQYQQALGRKVQLVSFCRLQGDEKAIEKFLLLCPETLRKDVSTLHYNGTNWKEICQAISAAECVVASRCHSMVLGVAYGVPTVAISYSNKTAQLLADMGYEDVAIMPEGLKDAKAEAAVAIPKMDISQWKAGSEVHFQALDRLLKL